MKLYFFKDDEGNFGDDLNPWLWPRLLGADFFDDDANELFVGIGTLLNHRVPAAGRRLVFGSGYGYGQEPNVHDGTWKFFCVRGPLTVERLGLDPSLAITDPALLIRSVFSTSSARSSTTVVSFMPHCDSARQGNWQDVCDRAGINLIDPRQPVADVLDALSCTRLLIAEAMHGAIIADALRIPWVPVRCYGHISEFKWRDWCASLCMTYSPSEVSGIFRGDEHLEAPIRLRNQIKRTLNACSIWSSNWTKPVPVKSSERAIDNCAQQLRVLSLSCSGQLSEDQILFDRHDRLLECLSELKRYRKD